MVVVDDRSRSTDLSESGDSSCQFSQQAAPSYLSANQVVCVKPGPMKSMRPAASLPTICQQMLPVTLCPEKMSKPLSPSAEDVEAALAECRWGGMTAVLIRRVSPAVCPGRIEVVD